MHVLVISKVFICFQKHKACLTCQCRSPSILHLPFSLCHAWPSGWPWLFLQTWDLPHPDSGAGWALAKLLDLSPFPWLIFFPNSMALLPNFCTNCPDGSHFAQMGSHFAQNTTNNPCSLLSRHKPLLGIWTYIKHPQPHLKTPPFLAWTRKRAKWTTVWAKWTSTSKMFEKWAKLF